jgi:beta-galactosidase/beta-glucuronidase
VDDQLVRPGARQQLEVRVSKESANESVNGAERHADFWIFGGIYRPVYLEALPPESIVGVPFSAPVAAGTETVTLETRVDRPGALGGMTRALPEPTSASCRSSS